MKDSGKFSKEELAAMKERARELKAEARSDKKRADGEADVLAKIKEMPEPERKLAKRLHDLILTSSPALSPKTWYGMPAYAKGDKIVCFFQSAKKFGTRYATLGFSDHAQLDDGPMWPTAFALIELNEVIEKKVVNLIKKAVS
jgi:hypothetical protein